MHHHLKASGETCHWGFFDATLTPRLTIKSGDSVTIDTVTGPPEMHPKPEAGFFTPPEIHDVHRNAEKTLPGHSLTGPVAVEGAKPGDVLVIEGLAGCSSMGGLSASIGRRQGEIGVVIDGSLRDPDHYARMGWPVWCRGFSPMSGKWRLETVEINGTVHIAGVQCHPGDLVCADEAGICIIPRKSVVEVLEMCEKFDAADAMKQKDIDAGMPLDEVVAKVYK
jgi:regulator of RNase E activity RraA